VEIVETFFDRSVCAAAVLEHMCLTSFTTPETIRSAITPCPYRL